MTQDGRRVGVAVLGSTGSIGRQTLEVIEHLRRLAGERFDVCALAAGSESPEFCRQVAAWPTARVWTAAGAPDRASGIDRRRWAAGGLVELATGEGVDLVVAATTGIAGLPAVLAALRTGRRVALANKETLVTGGHLVESALDEVGGDPFDRLERLRPIDSEHSAIWQCLLGEQLSDVARLVLTASGGPFRTRRPEELAAVTPGDALAHPTWRMGRKISIDSATLVNKAFEAIEARWLYGVPYSRIAAVIHPQSVVHSLVELTDGSYKAQLGIPDMRLPIQYAVTFPRRLPPVRRALPPDGWGALEFLPLDETRFPAYRLVREAAERGGNHGAVVNAADEAAVDAFLAGRIGFERIPAVLDASLARWGSERLPNVDEIAAVDREVRASLSAELAG